MAEAFERLTTWLVEHGGGRADLVPGLLSTFGPDLAFLLAVAAAALLLRHLHALALEAPDADPDHFLHGPRSGSPHALLFPYEAAFLAGGPGRVAETALAGLVEDGWLEASPGGGLRLGSGGDSVTVPDPLATAVLATVPPSEDEAPAGIIHSRAVELPEVLDVSAILYARRLLVSEATRRRLRLVRRALGAVLALAGAALVAVASVRSSDLRGTPVLGAGLALAGAAALAAAGWRRPQLFRTRLGEAALVSLWAALSGKSRWVVRRLWSSDSPPDGGPWADVDRIVGALQRPAGARPPELARLWGREDALMAVALRGTSGIADPGLRTGLEAPHRPRAPGPPVLTVREAGERDAAAGLQEAP